MSASRTLPSAQNLARNDRHTARTESRSRRRKFYLIVSDVGGWDKEETTLFPRGLFRITTKRDTPRSTFDIDRWPARPDARIVVGSAYFIKFHIRQFT